MKPFTADLNRDLCALAQALRHWSRRDDSKPQPEIRQAANDAVARIDQMLDALHQARGELASEIRASDDATAIRVDALLTRLHREAAQ